MRQTDKGLAPGADLASWLRSVVDGAGLQHKVELIELDPLIDSSNARPAHWQRIVDELRNREASADAFVVLHGTDTMSYSAAALSFALCDFGKPVAITGSQLPLGFKNSDAAANVLDTFRIVAKAHERHHAGVYLCFGGRVLNGYATSKVSSVDFDAFAGSACTFEERKLALSFASEILPYRTFDIAIFDLAPGINAARLKSLATPLPDAIIIRAFGSGNIPSDDECLIAVFEEVAAAGVPLVVTSQCATGGVEIGRYEASSPLVKLGAISGGSLTFEGCYVKTVFLLSQNLTGSDFRDAFARSIVGE